MITTVFPSNAAMTNRTRHRARWMSRVRLPLEAWSLRRRLLVGCLIAAVVFAAGANAWISMDVAGIHAGRAALAEERHKVAQAQAALAQLPALRRSAKPASSNVQTTTAWAPIDDVHAMSQLAVRSGVTLLTLAPAAANGADTDAVRTLHLSVQSDFLHLMIFLRGLSDLPVLVVPEDVTAKSNAGGLLVSATVRVFADLKPVATAPDLVLDDDMDADDEDVVFYDPFARAAQAEGSAPDAGLLRLAGLLRDRRRGLALLETADGAVTIERGQLLGNDRVTAMDSLGITLTSRLGSRTLALREAS
jgi:Tfp pilus assembly protein PilO